MCDHACRGGGLCEARFRQSLSLAEIQYIRVQYSTVLYCIARYALERISHVVKVVYGHSVLLKMACRLWRALRIYDHTERSHGVTVVLIKYKREECWRGKKRGRAL